MRLSEIMTIHWDDVKLRNCGKNNESSRLKLWRAFQFSNLQKQMDFVKLASLRSFKMLKKIPNFHSSTDQFWNENNKNKLPKLSYFFFAQYQINGKRRLNLTASTTTSNRLKSLTHSSFSSSVPRDNIDRFKTNSFASVEVWVSDETRWGIWRNEK